MISGVRDQDLVLGVAGDVPRVVELSHLGSFLPERHEKLSLDGEQLDPVVVFVRHDGPVHAVRAD